MTKFIYFAKPIKTLSDRPEVVAKVFGDGRRSQFLAIVGISW